MSFCIMPLKRYIKKGRRRLGQAIKKRYVTRTGKGLRMGKMVRDVAYLKSVLNPEKKRWGGTVSPSSIIGQVNGNDGGALVIDCSPMPNQSVTTSGRTGASIKLHASNFEIQVTEQASQSARIKFIAEVWHVKGMSTTSAGFGGSLNTIIRKLYQANPFVSTGSTPVIDYFSSLSPDYAGVAKRVRMFRFSLAPENLVTGVGGVAVTGTASYRFGIKYNRGKGHHVRFNGDDAGNVGITEGQLILVIRADRGNCSTSTVSTLLGVQDNIVSSGATIRYAINHFYYDN